MTPIVHPSIEPTLTRLGDSLPQGLLLTGHSGVGLATVARHLAANNLERCLQPRNSDGEVDQKRGSIATEQVRALYEQTRGKTPHERVILLDDIDRMTVPAQNAFLKLLEEPPAKLHFIATSHAPDRLIATIRSRLQSVHIPLLTAEQTNHLVATLPKTAPTAKLRFMAAGRPAELWRLTHDDAYFASAEQAFVAAKAFVSGTLYQRIIQLNQVRGREEALDLIQSSESILRATLQQAPSRQTIAQLETLLYTREAIERNANPRIQLLRSVV